MRYAWIALVAGCAGDGGSAADTSGTPPPVDTDGACGEVSSADVTITGRVVDGDDRPVAGARVWLEERAWSPGRVHGEATTDGAGAFALEARDLPIVEDCWGTIVQFWLVGESGALTGEKPMNPGIQDAVYGGTHAVDLGQFPLILR